MAINGYTGCRVFHATVSDQRERLGEKVSAWLQENPGIMVTDTVVSQSSDYAFHCVSIVIFFRERG